MSRITPGTMIVLVFAVLFGLVGAYAVKRALTRPEPPKAEARPPERPVFVPLASADLAAGRPLTLGDIAILSVQREQLPKMKLPAEYMSNPQQIVGRILREPMKKGDAFTTVRFFPEGHGPGIADRLKPGLRAVTIEIDGTGAVSGFATPGNIVDILFRTKNDVANDIPEATLTLISGVEVLAVNANPVPGVVGGTPPPKTVTLAVTADQANALKVAEGRGLFTLSLRNPKDETVTVSTGPQSLEGLLNLPRRERPFVSEIYRGGMRTTLTFERESKTRPFQLTSPVVDRPSQAPASTPTSTTAPPPAPAPAPAAAPKPLTSAPVPAPAPTAAPTPLSQVVPLVTPLPAATAVPVFVPYGR